MTKEETIKVLQSIEDRAVDFPYMTACDWVAIAAAKRHLGNSIEVKEVDLEKEIDKYISDNFFGSETTGFFASRTKEEPNDQDIALCAKHFFELGLKAQKGK